MKRRGLVSLASAAIMGGSIFGIATIGFDSATTASGSTNIPVKKVPAIKLTVMRDTSAVKAKVQAKVTAVSFSGNTAHPVITITGSRLAPKALSNPTTAPQQQISCAVQGTTSNNMTSFGKDFGDSLYLRDLTTSPNWSAGRYRPNSQLDCVGLVMKRYTSTKIVYSLGNAYPSYPGVASHYALRTGDQFVISVNGMTVTGRVRWS